KDRKAITELVGDGDIDLVSVASGKETIEKIKSEKFDCIVVDLGLPDMSGFELIENIRKDQSYADLPIIVYTARELTKKESAHLSRLAEAVIVKDMSSIDKLLDETALFLHRVETNLPQ